MARILGVVLLVGLAWLVLRHVLGDKSTRAARPRGTTASPRFEKTVRCGRCGAHTPLALARRDETCDDYICRAHDLEADDD